MEGLRSMSKGLYNNQGRRSGGYKRPQIYVRAQLSEAEMFSMDEIMEDIQKHGYNEEEAIEMFRYMLDNHVLEKLPNGLYKKL